MYFYVVWALIITIKNPNLIQREVGSIILKLKPKVVVVADGGSMLASNLV